MTLLEEPSYAPARAVLTAYVVARLHDVSAALVQQNVPIQDLEQRLRQLKPILLAHLVPYVVPQEPRAAVFLQLLAEIPAEELAPGPMLRMFERGTQLRVEPMPPPMELVAAPPMPMPMPVVPALQAVRRQRVSAEAWRKELERHGSLARPMPSYKVHVVLSTLPLPHALPEDHRRALATSICYGQARTSFLQVAARERATVDWMFAEALGRRPQQPPLDAQTFQSLVRLGLGTDDRPASWAVQVAVRNAEAQLKVCWDNYYRNAALTCATLAPEGAAEMFAPLRSTAPRPLPAVLLSDALMGQEEVKMQPVLEPTAYDELVPIARQALGLGPEAWATAECGITYEPLDVLAEPTAMADGPRWHFFDFAALVRAPGSLAPLLTSPYSGRPMTAQTLFRLEPALPVAPASP